MSKEISDGIYAVGGPSNSMAVFFSKGDPTLEILNPGIQLLVNSKYLPWGDNNMWPLDLVNKLKLTSVASGGLEVLQSAHFGLGFRLYQAVETDTYLQFKEKIPTSFPEINDFFNRTKFNIFISEIIGDYETHKIAFPEYLLSPNFEKIISVRRLKAGNCRFSAPDKYGVINTIGVNADWFRYNDQNTTVIRCFDQHTPIEEIKAYCAKHKIYTFTIPVIDTLLIEKNYPAVGWQSSFKNGWVDVVLSLPAFKKAMFEQQLNVKYLIHIADDYFHHIFGEDWDTLGAKEREEFRNDLVKTIDSSLKGNGAGGKSIISPFFRDRDSGQEIKGIQIEAVPQPQSNGDFLLDGSAANYEILTGMGVDPCLITGGAFGGKSLGGGSGSDKREAYTILCSKMPIKQVRTLQIFENLKLWNNWEPTVFGKFPNLNLTTLDKNPNGQIEVVN